MSRTVGDFGLVVILVWATPARLAVRIEFSISHGLDTNLHHSVCLHRNEDVAQGAIVQWRFQRPETRTVQCTAAGILFGLEILITGRVFGAPDRW